MSESVRSWRLTDVGDKGIGAEFMTSLVTGTGWRIEWIVSRGQLSDWYDQNEDEWVLVVVGRARLEIEGEEHDRSLEPGDAVWLPAHTRHRVTWTDPDQATVWCAVFVG